MKAGVLGVTVALGLAGCVTTQEMPLAQNVVRLDTQASGLLFTGQAVPQTMRMAAQATLSRGYTHFRLQDAGLAQGSETAGFISNTTYTANPGAVYGFGSVTPIRRPTASAAATVVMYRAGDPGSQGAFEAAAVLKQYAQ